MQIPTNPMAGKLFINPIPISMSIFLNFVSNILNPFPRPTNLYALKHGLSSNLTELPDILMNIAYHDHSRIITMKSIFITNNVNIKIISILKYVVIRHTMSQDIIDTSTTAFLVAMEAYPTWVGILWDYFIMD